MAVALSSPILSIVPCLVDFTRVGIQNFNPNSKDHNQPAVYAVHTQNSNVESLVISYVSLIYIMKRLAKLI